MGGLPLQDLAVKFEEEIGQVRSEDDLARLKAAYLGKQGHLTSVLKTLGTLPPEERPAVGAQVNELKQLIEVKVRDLTLVLASRKKSEKLGSESVDVTLPGRAAEKGGLHPITQVLDAVEDIFRGIGFSVYEGPEVETDFFNFEALNIPENHPARDMQDTFYLEGQKHLLRTHTSPVQIHVMKKNKPPIRMIAPGVVYRRDSDVTHSPMFHQVEGLVVDENVTFADLKGTVAYFLRQLFGEGLKVRFRPSYFPFTEPSAEVDLQCFACQGKKQAVACRICKGTGWIEMGGSGMVHPAVFEHVGYDPKKIRGFAFGMGIERLTMLKFGITDIRLFFENDLRFLRQFS
jgi:phenylalanyl-tRNA synthetase alpha chain